MFYERINLLDGCESWRLLHSISNRAGAVRAGVALASDVGLGLGRLRDGDDALVQWRCDLRRRMGIRWFFGQTKQSRNHSALEILKQRFARGGIEKDQFEANKKALSCVSQRMALLASENYCGGALCKN